MKKFLKKSILWIDENPGWATLYGSTIILIISILACRCGYEVLAAILAIPGMIAILGWGFVAAVFLSAATANVGSKIKKWAQE